MIPRWRWLMGAGVLALVVIGPVFGALSPAAGAPAAMIRVEGQSQPLNAPLQDVDGVGVVPLRPVVEYLGGRASWNATLRKVLLKSPSGHKLEVVVGFPRALIDGKRWIRLPHLLIWRENQPYVSPESFSRMWRELGEPSFQYNALTKTLAKKSHEPIPVPSSAPTALPTPKPALEAALPKVEPVTVAQPMPPHAAGLKCVVIDAGHGGRDPGAIGPTRLYEKTVVLEIAQQVADMVKHNLGCKVVLTRDNDTFIPLPERPEIANRIKADLFVSIHANASPDRRAYGSQVFIYNREASSRKAAEVAKFENKDANYLEIIKDDLRQSVHETDSITVAGLISQEFEKGISETRRIERAPFYVLAKSHMPSVLVETAFISNPEEEAKLRQREFCAKLARAICRGLEGYAEEKK